MVVPIQRPRVWIRLFDQVHAIPAHPLVIGEDGEPRVVKDVQFAFQILHPEDGMESFGENREMAVGMPTEDASLGRIGMRRADIHRVLRHKNPSIGRGADHRWITDLRRFRHQFHAPARQSFRDGDGEDGRYLHPRNQDQGCETHDRLAEPSARVSSVGVPG